LKEKRRDSVKKAVAQNEPAINKMRIRKQAGKGKPRERLIINFFTGCEANGNILLMKMS
jgi:hypothetical protein